MDYQKQVKRAQLNTEGASVNNPGKFVTAKAWADYPELKQAGYRVLRLQIPATTCRYPSPKRGQSDQKSPLENIRAGFLK